MLILSVAWGNRAIFTQCEVTLKWRAVHSLSCQNHRGFPRIYHVFLLTPLDSHWSVKSIADDAPQKKCDHGCMVCYVTCWCSWYFFGLINSEHLEPFPCEPSNDAQGMEAWSTSFESTLWKGLGNEHCAKVPVKRELRSSGYRKVGVEA